MRFVRSLVVASIALLSGCARVVTSGDSPNSGYIEIANPAATMSPGAPATIFVPREYTDNDVPRGSILIEYSYESVVNAIKGISQPGIPLIAPDETSDSYNRPPSYR